MRLDYKSLSRADEVLQEAQEEVQSLSSPRHQQGQRQGIACLHLEAQHVGVPTNKDDIEDEEEKRDIIDVVGAYVVAPNSRIGAVRSS